MVALRPWKRRQRTLGHEAPGPAAAHHGDPGVVQQERVVQVVGHLSFTSFTVDVCRFRLLPHEPEAWVWAVEHLGPVERGEVAVDPDPEAQLRPEGRRAFPPPRIFGSPARPGRRWPRRRRGSLRGSGTRRPLPPGARRRASLQSRPAGAPPAGSGPRPSARRRTARCPGASWNQRSPSSNRLAGMGPWVSCTFSVTGASPRTSQDATMTRAVRWALSDWT